MLLDTVLEAGLHGGEEGKVPLHGQEQHPVEVVPVPERHAEVPGVQRRRRIDRLRARPVAHDLIAEEVERDPVVVAAGEVAAELPDVELEGLVEVAGRDGEMEDVP